ncbi:MAG: HAMP domain-containing histidine kinase [Elusimicrobia bacterium]|nr:HAMP domain-containing histidine kinase [Elusimicrobiota bacterium]
MSATQPEPSKQFAPPMPSKAEASAACPVERVEGFIHDVNSKCASLKSAAGLLRNASDQERRELLELMKQQAEKLVQDIASFNRCRGDALLQPTDKKGEA